MSIVASAMGLLLLAFALLSVVFADEFGSHGFPSAGSFTGASALGSSVPSRQGSEPASEGKAAGHGSASLSGNPGEGGASSSRSRREGAASSGSKSRFHGSSLARSSGSAPTSDTGSASFHGSSPLGGGSSDGTAATYRGTSQPEGSSFSQSFYTDGSGSGVSGGGGSTSIGGSNGFANGGGGGGFPSGGGPSVGSSGGGINSAYPNGGGVPSGSSGYPSGGGAVPSGGTQLGGGSGGIGIGGGTSGGGAGYGSGSGSGSGSISGGVSGGISGGISGGAPSSTSTPTIDGGCSCDFWSSHTDDWPSPVTPLSTIGDIFGSYSSSSSLFGPTTTLVDALQSTYTDPYHSLLKQTIAALLNSLSRRNYQYTPQMVKQQYNAALVSKEAATQQAIKFQLSNGGGGYKTSDCTA